MAHHLTKETHHIIHVKLHHDILHLDEVQHLNYPLQGEIPQLFVGVSDDGIADECVFIHIVVGDLVGR